MAPDVFKVVAVLGAVTWLVAAFLVRRRPRASAVLSGVLALYYVTSAAPSLLRWAHDPQAYVDQYGTAALRDLQSAGGIVVLGLIALTGVVLTFVRRPWGAWVTLIATLPVVAVLVYLAFWFRIF